MNASNKCFFLKHVPSLKLQLFYILLGLLWNLSSCDNLKEDLINDALPVLTDYVIIPHTSQGLKSPETMESETFHNATGCLRYGNPVQTVRDQTLDIFVAASVESETKVNI